MLMTELVRNRWNFSNGEVVLDVSGERVGDRLRIAVRAQSSGFDMQYLSKLFEPFQRLHGADEGAGNGMGLAIAQRNVERHSGRIHAESEPGGRPTLFLELPSPAAAPHLPPQKT